MATFGDKILSAPDTWLSVDSSGANQIGYNGSRTFVVTNPGWFTKVGVFAERVSGTPKAYLGIWITHADGTPEERMAYTEQVVISSTPDNNEADIAWTSTEIDGALRVETGDIVTLGWVLHDGVARIGITGSGAVPYYYATVGASLPASPFTEAGSGIGALAFYAEFIANAAPAPPTITSPADDASVDDFTPSFSLSFSDPDTIALTLDMPLAVELDVRDTSLTSIYWGGQSGFSYLSDMEQEDAAVVRVYNGVALTGGEDLRWRARFFDLHMEPGAWSSWRDLHINDGPVVTLTQPSGKKDGPTEDIGWSGTYDWADGPSEALQFRILKGSVIFRESDEIIEVVADGGSFSLTGAEVGLGYIGTGIDFNGQARAKYDGVWGEWSTPIAFRTNAIPSIPTRLQPPGGAESSSYPLVRFVTWDSDDTMGSHVKGVIEITKPNSDIVEVDTWDYNSATREFGYQMTGTEMSVPGTYLFRAKAVDVSASDGESAWSDYIAFDLIDGLVVTITSPTELSILTDSTPAFTVSLNAGTVSFARIIIYEPGTENVRWDSGVFVHNSTSLPSIVDGVLLNDRSYDAVIWIQNNSGASGYSGRRRFSIAYNAPQELANAEVSLYSYPMDPEPTAALFSFPRANVPVTSFGGYLIRRRSSGESIDKATIIKRIPNLAQNRWIDPYAPANKPQIYSVSYLDASGKESSRVEATIDIPMTVIVVQSAIDPSKRIVLRWKPATRRGTPRRPLTMYQPLGTGGKAIAVAGPGYQHVMEGTFRLLTDKLGSREAHFQAGLDLYLSGHPVQWKEERLSFFGAITAFEWDAFDFTDSVKIRVEETLVREGEESNNMVLRSDGTYGPANPWQDFLDDFQWPWE